MKNIEVKKQIVKEVSETLKKSSTEKGPSTVLVDYSGITASEMIDLRKKLAETGYRLKIVKNTLIKRVFDKLNIALPSNLAGQHAILLSDDGDIISAIKTLFTFIKENEKGSVNIGVLEGEILESERVKALSKLPSKKELIAKVVSGFSSPVRGFVYTLNGVQSKFIRVVQAIKDQKS